MPRAWSAGSSKELIIRRNQEIIDRLPLLFEEIAQKASGVSGKLLQFVVIEVQVEDLEFQCAGFVLFLHLASHCPRASVR